MDALMRELSPRLGRICASIAPRHGEDALQETLIVVLRNLGSLREAAAIHGWARRIAVHESITSGAPGGCVAARGRPRRTVGG
jgi:DNA-directed RNA polymerase specialized sigma24 family protein